MSVNVITRQSNGASCHCNYACFALVMIKGQWMIALLASNFICQHDAGKQKQYSSMDKDNACQHVMLSDGFSRHWTHP